MIKVFLSHNSSDKPLVTDLAERLKLEENIEPWFDKWNLIPGDPWQEEIEQALDQCQVLLMLIGEGELGPWQHEEMRIAITRRVNNKEKSYRVVPVFLPGTLAKAHEDLPPFLSRYASVRFQKTFAEENNYHYLLCGIKGKKPGPSSKIKPIKSIGRPINVNQRVKLIRLTKRITEVFSHIYIYPDECNKCLSWLGDIQAHYSEALDDDWPALFRAKSLIDDIQSKIMAYRLICQAEKEITENSRKEILELLESLKKMLE
ncbi:toll/interleukin-1 receptor domain-containing protein [Flavilitoribacter nigricans]|nr:toll/interleukin-1 receptor domain-containing protein [Flavilitoribacter nigricans]